jgi:hypothetical protein
LIYNILLRGWTRISKNVFPPSTQLSPSFLLLLSNEAEFGMRPQRFLIGFFMAVVALSAQAFDRPFPATAKRGFMTPASYPTVVIDGTNRTLSVSARIWNTSNLIQMPASLSGSSLPINYTENNQGEIDRVWILNQEEAMKPAPAQLIKSQRPQLFQ